MKNKKEKKKWNLKKKEKTWKKNKKKEKGENGKIKKKTICVTWALKESPLGQIGDNNV